MFIKEISADLLQIFILTEGTVEIQADNPFVGKVLYCKCMCNDQQVYAQWQLTTGIQYATINPNGRIDVNSGVQNQQITIQCSYCGQTATKTITISYDNQFTIEGSDTMHGTSGKVVARYNQETVTPIWSISSGGSCATIDANGNITII